MFRPVLDIFRFGVVGGVSTGLECISMFFKSLCEASAHLPYVCLVANPGMLFCMRRICCICLGFGV